MRQFAKLIAIPKQLTISILGLFLVFTQPVFAGVDKGPVVDLLTRSPNRGLPNVAIRDAW